MGALREVWAEEWCDLASVLRRTSDCCIQKRPRRAEWLVRMLWGSCRWEMVVIWAGEGSVEVVRKDFHSGWIKEMAGEVVLGPFIRPAAEFPLAYGPAGWFIQTASALASLWVWPRSGFCRRSEGRMSLRSEDCPPSILPSSPATVGWLWLSTCGYSSPLQLRSLDSRKLCPALPPSFTSRGNASSYCC